MSPRSFRSPRLGRHSAIEGSGRVVRTTTRLCITAFGSARRNAAALTAIRPFLDAGESEFGMAVDVRHFAATLIEMDANRDALGQAYPGKNGIDGCNSLMVRLRPPRLRTNSNAFQTARTANGSDRSVYSSMLRRSNSASIASKRISAGITTSLVQRMIAARATIRYSVMQTLLPMRDVGLLGEVDISARSLEDFRTLQGARAWLARVVN